LLAARKHFDFKESDPQGFQPNSPLLVIRKNWPLFLTTSRDHTS